MKVGSFVVECFVFVLLLQVGLRLKSNLRTDFYYDMEYCVDYSTFRCLVIGKQVKAL